MSESRKEKADRYLNKLEKHIEKAENHKKYSSDRFDILCISISSTALIFSIGFVNDVIKNIEDVDTWLLKTSWLLLTMTVIFNFSSQMVSYYANSLDIKITKNLVKEKRGISMIGKQNLMIKKCDRLNWVTVSLNWFSLIGIILGLGFLVLFFSNNI